MTTVLGVYSITVSLLTTRLNSQIKPQQRWINCFGQSTMVFAEHSCSRPPLQPQRPRIHSPTDLHTGALTQHKRTAVADILTDHGNPTRPTNAPQARSSSVHHLGTRVPCARSRPERTGRMEWGGHVTCHCRCRCSLPRCPPNSAPPTPAGSVGTVHCTVVVL